MSIIYANSVGIITKDIYIIKNKINEKNVCWTKYKCRTKIFTTL